MTASKTINRRGDRDSIRKKKRKQCYWTGHHITETTVWNILTLFSLYKNNTCRLILSIFPLSYAIFAFTSSNSFCSALNFCFFKSLNLSSSSLNESLIAPNQAKGNNSKSKKKEKKIKVRNIDTRVKRI